MSAVAAAEQCGDLPLPPPPLYGLLPPKPQTLHPEVLGARAEVGADAVARAPAASLRRVRGGGVFRGTVLAQCVRELAQRNHLKARNNGVTHTAIPVNHFILDFACRQSLCVSQRSFELACLSTDSVRKGHLLMGSWYCVNLKRSNLVLVLATSRDILPSILLSRTGISRYLHFCPRRVFDQTMCVVPSLLLIFTIPTFCYIVVRNGKNLRVFIIRMWTSECCKWLNYTHFHIFFMTLWIRQILILSRLTLRMPVTDEVWMNTLT